MGGKSGGYTGPTAVELEAQKDAYRSQWDLEREKEDLQKVQDEENATKEAATDELRSRRGVSDVLSSGQIGFTKKVDDDELLGM